MEIKKLKPYTEMTVRNTRTNTVVRGIISSDCITVRIDVFDGLDNYEVVENGKPTTRPLTYT